MNDALRGLADDLKMPAADRVCAALILSSSRRGPGLHQSLKALAETVADEVRMRRGVEAERAKPRKNARQLTGLACLYVVGLIMNRQLSAPYHEPLGQLVLLALLCWFVGCLVWMWRMAQPPKPVRFITAERAR
jgi:tight adherence protein B